MLFVGIVGEKCFWPLACRGQKVVLEEQPEVARVGTSHAEFLFSRVSAALTELLDLSQDLAMLNALLEALHVYLLLASVLVLRKSLAGFTTRRLRVPSCLEIF